MNSNEEVRVGDRLSLLQDVRNQYVITEHNM